MDAERQTCIRCGLTDSSVQPGARFPEHPTAGHCLVALRDELQYHQELMGWLAHHLHGWKWQDLNLPEPALPNDLPVRFVHADDFWPWLAQLRIDL